MSNDNVQNTGLEHENNCDLPLAYPYVPMQFFQNRYPDEDAIVRGTLYPELDLPFKNYVIDSDLPKTPKTILMCVHFVCFELRLYLDTHPYDEKALEYYNTYSKMLMKLKEQHAKSLEQPGYNSWGAWVLGYPLTSRAFCHPASRFPSNNYDPLFQVVIKHPYNPFHILCCGRGYSCLKSIFRMPPAIIPSAWSLTAIHMKYTPYSAPK